MKIKQMAAVHAKLADQGIRRHGGGAMEWVHLPQTDVGSWP